MESENESKDLGTKLETVMTEKIELQQKYQEST